MDIKRPPKSKIKKRIRTVVFAVVGLAAVGGITYGLSRLKPAAPTVDRSTAVIETVKRGQMHSLSGNLASMANGLCYAIAAQIAYPERQCISFVGDGGFSMLMAEFATCVKYQLPVKVFVIKNNTLGMIKWEQMVFLGNPEYGCQLQPINFAAFAQACGATGFTVEDPQDCGRVVEQALDTPGPVLVEAVVDPFEPPMPPKVSLKQATRFAESLMRGEPNREKIIATVLSDKVREIV